MGVVVHVVDNGDAGNEGKWFDERHTKSHNSVVIRISPMCNGVEQIVKDVIAAVKDKKIDGLIFYGHGAPGIQLMGEGSGVKSSKGAFSPDPKLYENSAITTETLDSPSWRALRPHFAKGAHLALKGCNTGAGEKGDDVIAKLSKTLGVPVTAATSYQATGSTDFVGETKTARPSGKVAADKSSKVDNQKNFDALPLWMKAALLYKNTFDKPKSSR